MAGSLKGLHNVKHTEFDFAGYWVLHSEAANSHSGYDNQNVQLCHGRHAMDWMSRVFMLLMLNATSIT